MVFPPVLASRPWRRAPGAELSISIHGLDSAKAKHGVTRPAIGHQPHSTSREKQSARRSMASPALLLVINHTAPPEKNNQRVSLCLSGCSLFPTYCWSEPTGAICRTAPIACESGLCTQWARCPPAPTTPSCLAPQPTRSHLCTGGASVVLRSKLPITTMQPSRQSMQPFAKITKPIRSDRKLTRFMSCAYLSGAQGKNILSSGCSSSRTATEVCAASPSPPLLISEVSGSPSCAGGRYGLSSGGLCTKTTQADLNTFYFVVVEG
jgi:hypothetical protein